MFRGRDGGKALAPRVAGGGALLIALIAVAALTASPAPAQPRITATPTATTATLDPAQARDFWTPERVAAAEPLDLAESTGEPVVTGPEVFSAAATPFSSRVIDNPRRYPNRVHGKLVGYYAGVGIFSCSATVVSSGSKSLITTAGHCVYDKGGTNRFAAALAFAPAYGPGNSQPYGVWGATNIITTRQWVRRGSLDYDLAMIRIQPKGVFRLQRIVGSRGIGFDQPLRQRESAFGYPASGNKPQYDGNHLVRCDSGYVPDEIRHGGPRSRGLRCDMQQGSSGGGIVAQHSFVVSNVSHGHVRNGRIVPGRLYGPDYGKVAKSLYKANRPGWPSIGPVGCSGKVVTIAGTAHKETLRGTNGQDIIAALGGNDRIKASGGQDMICGGDGDDTLIGGNGKDRVVGGGGRDFCGGAKGNDSLKQCESKRRPRIVG